MGRVTERRGQRKPNRKKMQTLRPDKVACIHHWMIEPPSGEVSIGICKFCGGVKGFQNFVALGVNQKVVIGPASPDLVIGLGNRGADVVWQY